jgi:hypothetical protein
LVATGVSVLALIAAAAAFRATQAQLTIAREQQRPWIKVSAFPAGDLSPYPGDPGVAVEVLFEMSAENAGKSPAANVKMWRWVQDIPPAPPEGLRPGPSAPSIRDLERAHCKELEEQEQGDEFITPEQNWTYPALLTISISDEKFQKNATHEGNREVGVAIQVIVCAVYRSIGEKIWHHTAKTYVIVRHRGHSVLDDDLFLPSRVTVPQENMGFQYADGSTYMD